MKKEYRKFIIGGVVAVVCVLLILLSVFTVLTGEVAIILGIIWFLSGVFFLKQSNINDMSGMFRSFKGTTLDLSSFDTSDVTNMSDMFSNYKATTLDLSRFNPNENNPDGDEE